MKSLILKEWRENLKWVALPGLVILMVFLIDSPDEPMPDVTGAYLFGLTAAVFGAGLGFLQLFFESHGDKRSLLLHRPLSPSRIFLGKALAGVALYVLALGIPFACLECWFATPGNMPAPYHWRTGLPWLADILSGLVYYFAGMLVAQRDVRWYASRCLPLATAFCCSYLATIVPEFWQALVVIGIFVLFVGGAAWGSFCTAGAYAPQPRLSKAALILTSLSGLLILSVLGKQTIGKWADSGIEDEYTIDRQGRVLFQRSKLGIGVIERTDLNGQQVADLTPREGAREGAPLIWTETPEFRSYRNSGRFYVRCVNDSKPGNERWYYDHARGRLCGYDAYYHQLLGSFGPDGFSPADRQPAERFAGEFRYRCAPSMARPSQYLIFPGRVYTVDFARRTIRAIFAPPVGETVAFASRWSDPLDKKRTGLVVSTDQSIHFLTVEGALVVSVPRLYTPVRSLPVLAGPLEKPERYGVCYPSYFEWTTVLEPDEYKNLTCELYEYDRTGREIARQIMPPIPYPQASSTQALYGLVTPMTEAALLVGTSRYLRSEARLQAGTRKPVLLHDLDSMKYYIPGTAPNKVTPSGLIAGYLALMLFSASASALGCFVLARSYAYSRASCLGWALGGLCFGWVGLLLMLAVQEWPARLVCPKCRKLRVVSRDQCEHCGAAHAAPAPDGTEIFEPTIAAPLAALIGR